MPDERQDIRRTLAAAGMDLAAICAAATEAVTREDRAVRLIRAFGMLRQRDLELLLDLSSATISRLVRPLLSAGTVQEQIFKDGDLGRPAAWLFVPESEPPTYQQRQVIAACLPDLITWLHDSPAPTSPASVPNHAHDERAVTTEHQPAVPTAGVPSALLQERQAPIAVQWSPSSREHSAAPASPAAVAAPALEALPTIRHSDALTPPPPSISTVAPHPMRCVAISPRPPWEPSWLQRHAWWGSIRTWRRGDRVACRLGTMFRSWRPRLHRLGRQLRTCLQRLRTGIQQLVWYIDDLSAIMLERRWLLLGIAVVILASVLVGVQRRIVSITLPVASALFEVTPTAPPTATPVRVLRAQVVGTGKLGLIVRDLPAGKRVGKLANGTEVVIVAGPQTIASRENPVWWQVRRGDLVGWVSARFLSFLEAGS
jgi:hypothetical protein